MSTSWDVFCRDCNAELGLGLWDAAEVCALVAHAAELVAIAKWLGETYFQVKRHDLPLDLRWFAAHDGHRLAVLSEYGRLEGCCNFQPVNGGPLVCWAPADHEGEHVFHRRWDE